MNNKLICPFCNETELEKGIELRDGCFIMGCPKCKKFAHEVFWQELIRTRKALDVAVEELTKIKVVAESVGIGFFMTAAIFALAKIKTALEQKDNGDNK